MTYSLHEAEYKIPISVDLIYNYVIQLAPFISATACPQLMSSSTYTTQCLLCQAALNRTDEYSLPLHTGEAENTVVCHCDQPQPFSLRGCGPFANYWPPQVSTDLHLSLVPHASNLCSYLQPVLWHAPTVAPFL